jgi:hypothetical protein
MYRIVKINLKTGVKVWASPLIALRWRALAMADSWNGAWDPYTLYEVRKIKS